MHKFYEELMRQMEQDARRSDEWLRRFLQSVLPPDKFWEPQVDVYETKDALKVKVELAGVRSEDIHLELTGDGSALTVRGCRRDGELEASDRTMFHQMEVYLGPFERTVPLPPRLNLDRDAIQANFRDGFLLVTVPKLPVPARPITTSIPVQGA
jgi:HSP20 family protein